MKPSVLVFAFDLMAHYTRCIVVAESLRPHFEVLFQSSHYDDLVIKAGFQIFGADRLAERELVAAGKRDDLMIFPRAELEQVMLAHCIAIRKYQPAFVIGDMCTTLNMSAEITKVPYISLINAYLSRHYDEPFTLPSCMPNLTAQIADVPPFFRARVQSREGLIAVTQSQREMRYLRRKYTLSKKLSLAEELEGDQTWICDSPELHPLRDNLPVNTHLIGPLIYRPTHLAAAEHRQRSDRKTILVSMGSSGEWDVLKLLTDPVLGEYDFIVCGRPPALVMNDNIQFIEFANFDDLMPSIDVVLCHGGNGTIYQAFAHGVPCLMLPRFFEQRFNARKVAEKQWGQCLKGSESAAELAQALREWSDRDLSSAENAVRMATRSQSSQLSNLCQVYQSSSAVSVEVLDDKFPCVA